MRLLLMILLCSFAVGANAMTFTEFTREAFKKSDLRTTNELREKYDYWDEMSKLSAIVPLVDGLIKPQYVYDNTNPELYGTLKYYDYKAQVSLTQSLPSNTDISASFAYDYLDYKNVGTSHQGLLNISVEQTLWGVNTPYHQYRLWRNAHAERNFLTKTYRLDLLKECYTLYVNVCAAEQEYNLAKSQFDRYRDIHEAAQNKYAIGLMSIVDYSRIKKRYKFAELDMKNAERDRDEKRRVAEEFLNGPLGDVDFSIANISPEKLGNEPVDKREELTRTLDEAYRYYRIGVASDSLKLTGFFDVQYAGAGEENMDNFDYNNYVVGVKLSIPLANLMKFSGVKKEKLSYLIKKNEYAQELESVNKKFIEMKKDVAYYADKIKLYEEILPTMRENYRSSSNFFIMGAVTLQEMMTIEDEYIALEREYLAAILAYNTLAIEVSRYTGTALNITEEYHE